MIDAISAYSSSHDGRLKFHNTSRAKTLYGPLYSDGDKFVQGNSVQSSNKSSVNPLVVVGGGAAAISLITETIFSANELSKGNFKLIGDICRYAAIMGVVGALCLGLFNLIEKNIFDRICR